VARRLRVLLVESAEGFPRDCGRGGLRVDEDTAGKGNCFRLHCQAVLVALRAGRSRALCDRTGAQPRRPFLDPTVPISLYRAGNSGVEATSPRAAPERKRHLRAKSKRQATAALQVSGGGGGPGRWATCGRLNVVA